ncbi:MAG: TaqI-like C-terminal specificity domain-containing protein, partial [Candidatus Subteraquimicrobiales bacterium]|nr:TaqI-like C-terminal specificity domain-containing protein [Candidatus Subteraquimicrobiales bacterium]
QLGGEKDAWGWLQENYPAIANHLTLFKKQAENRYDKGEYWWELRSCDYYPEFEKTKICWGNLCKMSPFAIDIERHYINAPACILTSGNLYILGCVNSKLLWWFLMSIAAGRAGGFIEAKPIYVSQLPIRPIDFSNPTDKKRHDQMVELVDQMLELNKQLATAKTDHDKTIIQRQIITTDHQIDQLVYELYGLTEEEIKIVEED